MTAVVRNVYVLSDIVARHLDESIAKGSAIVGRIGDYSDRVHIYFEGNVYGASNMQRYAERVAVASGRLHDDAPTVAQMLIPSQYLVRVGTWDGERVHLFLRTAHQLHWWLGMDDDADLDPRELVL